MFSALISLSVAWNVLIFSHEIAVDAAPSFTEEPPNPSHVDEGDNITLRWNYSINGTFRDSRFFLVTGETIALKDGSGLTVAPAFSGSVEAFISDSEATLTLLHVDRSDDRGYQYVIQNTNLQSASSVVNVFVQFKPDNVQLLTNFTANKTCPGSFWNFTCLVGPAKPDMFSYQLLANDVVVDTDSSGMWVRLLSISGVFTYKCLANNTVGRTISENEKNITVAGPASVERIVSSSNRVIEGDPFVVTCNASGDPKLSIYWIKEDNNQRINGSILNFTSINRNDNGTYRCEAENDCASDSRAATIIVFHPPNITYISANMTVNQSESVDLTCRAHGNPEPDIIWSKDGNITNSSFTVRGKSDEGLYVCNASNGIGNASIKSVFIAVEYFGPFNTSFTTLTKNPNIVYLNASFNLSCSAQASPPARYRFYRGQQSLGNISVGNIFNTSVVQRTSQVNYSCTPFNYFGDGETKVITVEVYYSPQVTERNKTYLVSPGDSATLTCPVDGNPPPSVQWYKGNDNSGQPLRTGKTWKIDEPTSNNSGLYTCWANNSVGNVTATVILKFETTTSTTNPPKNCYLLEVKLVDSPNLLDKVNRNSQPAPKLSSTFVAEVDKLYENDTNYDRTEVTELSESNGSVIVSFEMCFKTPLTESEGLAKLRDAVDNRKLGNFTVEALRVIQTNPTTAATGNPSNSSKKDDPPWPIIGGVIGAVVLVIIIILLVAWWVHNKRKCRRKGTKIHNSESEVLHGQNDIEDGAYARVNGGYDGRYADSGPPSANGTNKVVQQPQPQPQPEQQQQQAAAAPPAYAIVDKSKKKKKKAEAEDPYAEVEDPKKDKKTADPSTHDYAVVNKSKKKKKEEDENAYATVDKSKKSKKRQQKPKAPGEVLYADLGDFQPVQPLPTVSTSPEPLAPIKKPTPYQGTEYADITQFLKGNATLPEGQSTEMQPTYANAGGGQEAANKENANTGGEGDIEPKETPM